MNQREEYSNTQIENQVRSQVLQGLIGLNLNQNFLRFLKKNLHKSKAQLLQDLIALYLGKTGFYVEFGAADGVSLSNTYILEKEFGWNGILAEPARIWQSELALNRSAKISTDCIWSESNKKLEFNETEDPMLATVREFSHSDLWAEKRVEGESYLVNTLSLNDLLKNFNAPPFIDYLSIDTEGTESQILSTFDFSGYKFGFISIEHNYGSQRQFIRTILEENGYILILNEVSKWDDWYICRDYEPLFGCKQRKRKYQVLISRLRDLLLTPFPKTRWAKSKFQDFSEGSSNSSLDINEIITRPFSSEVVSLRRFKDKNFSYWMNFIGEKPMLHSKQFQWYSILTSAYIRTLDFDGNTNTPKLAIGFGVGKEPIPRALTKLNYGVVATDFYTGPDSEQWRAGNQLKTDHNLIELGTLNLGDIKAGELYSINLDMNKLPASFKEKYDFVWSTCALGHIGGYSQGINFIIQSLSLLKPGGRLVHTTEIDENDHSPKVDFPDISFYKSTDIQQVIEKINQLGFVAEVYVNEKSGAFLDNYVISEPWDHSKPHIRLRMLGTETLAFTLQVRRPTI